ALGVIMGASRVARAALDPIVDTFMSAPLSALVPVAVAIFGIRPTVVVATVFMFSFFVIVVNTATGVRGTEISLVQMARGFGAPPRRPAPHSPAARATRDPPRPAPRRRPGGEGDGRRRDADLGDRSG